jgi:hypothetical protein
VIYIILPITIITIIIIAIPQEYADCIELLIYVHLNTITQHNNKSGIKVYKNDR